MTDNQRAFIRGIGGRGSEVIATLVNLGGKNNLRLDGNDPNRIYFIAHDGCIGFVGADSEYAKILTDYYKKIKLPDYSDEEDWDAWKDGQLLVSIEKHEGPRFAILDNTTPTTDRFEAYLVLAPDNRVLLHQTCMCYEFRLATESETAYFVRQLDSLEKVWNPWLKRLEDKPKKENGGLINVTATLEKRSNDNYCMYLTLGGEKHVIASHRSYDECMEIAVLNIREMINSFERMINNLKANKKEWWEDMRGKDYVETTKFKPKE